MSGHSKWAGIKHKKALVDAKRGQLFTKLIKEITVAAKEGGGNLDTNARLRTAVTKAKEMNMPWENIERAIKRGTGELPGVSYETVIYEGYGEGGVAIMVEALTDNKNRTTAEIRNIFSKKGGNLAGTGSVSWMFSKKGYILIDKASVNISEDELLSIVLEAGAEDLKQDAKSYEITCTPQDLEKLKAILKQNGINYQVAEITLIPSSTIRLMGESAKKILELVDALESHDDVQNVYANFDIPDEIMEEMSTTS
ncbi:MAG: YebC/PmpR family DNA-binding transcriptional regulator [Candidatus Omnitrophica bacterium]|nr:YebC/PmpR family DNA-binding transcriptional regulator [Candidatus Omnitrophota bacterium]MCM8800354.1 YebC/PmpR family DNA-binding transcriptional regulator [Candidatus Omnitrophota bacterium]